MARGLIKHLKRINAPKHWMLDKLGGNWAPRPSNGPHKLRECLPLSLILRNRLKLALTRRETLMCVMRRYIKVDGKVRTDMQFPTGLMDVIEIEQAGLAFRLVYDTKGRFVLQKINAQSDETRYKLCRVQRVMKRNKASAGVNPHKNGQYAVVPVAVTHDGRTLRYVHPDIHANDTVKLELATGKVVEHLKFGVGQRVMCIRGHNIGRVGTLTKIEKHPGGFDIVHVRDPRGQEYATRLGNVFVIGGKSNVEHDKKEKYLVDLPGSKGIAYNAIELRQQALSKNKKSRK